ncbi:VWA domain-containing protein [Roseibium sp.]|uniref:VWA domain-containing protein n=1 Tax=Roseibium sp. TaxID=1936156 RepID=UPI003B519909
MNVLTRCQLIGLLTALSFAFPVAAAEAPRTTLVLDASGSMWGQIDGTPKISIAQNVISDLVRKLPGEIELGLTVYGHRRKGDCGDIESLIQPSKDSREAIIKGVNQIKPKGKTPLSAAVLQAAKELRHTEEKATVVLVSDGEETCNLDPCAVGRELEETGIGFTVHVVGFDIVEAKTREQLQCLAKETGGKYLNADSAAGLTEALTQVTAAEPVPEPTPEPEPQTASISGPSQAAAGSAISVAWEGPADRGDYIAILLNGDGEVFTSQKDVKVGNPLEIKVTPEIGQHELVYVDADARTIIARAPFEVTEVAASLSAADVATAGDTLEVSWTGPANNGDYVDIAVKDDVLPHFINYFDVSEGPSATLRMPSKPGDYELRYIANTDPRKILTKTPVTVEDVSLSMKAPKTAAAGSTINVLWNGTSNPKDYIAFALPGEPLPHIVTMAETGEGNPLSIPVPDQPGEYELRYFFAAHDRIVQTLTVTVE